MDDLSEKEQIELMREWWKENGTFVIAGIVLGVGGILGFNFWKSSQLETQLAASVQYEALTEDVADNRVEPAEAIAASIQADYAATIYADQARLAMAKLYMDQGRDDDAAQQLQALLDAGNSDELRKVARLRLAKINLYQGKPEAVLTLLEGFAESGFAARYSEAIGDAHVALGNYAEAEAAYSTAMNAPDADQLLDRSLLQMKIVDLPDSGSGDPVMPEVEAPEIEASDVESSAADMPEVESSDVDLPEAERSDAEPPAAATDEDAASEEPGA